MIKYYATNAQLAMGIVDLIGNRSSKDAQLALASQRRDKAIAAGGAPCGF
jgi:hypothetical protein